MSSRPATTRAEEAAVVAAVRGGDEAAFSALAERYRIASNACLSALERSPGRVLVAAVPAGDPRAVLPAQQRPDLGAPPADLPWLQPYPDRLLDAVAPSDSVNSALQRA